MTSKTLGYFSALAALLVIVPGFLGRRVINTLLYLIDLSVFTLRAVSEWKTRSSLSNRATYQSIVAQLIFSGVDALPAITVLGLAAGVSITAQLFFMLELLGSEQEIIGVITRLVVLEFGSLLTAVVVIGRSGSAIAVDLGNMKLNREIEGLELLGINVNVFFIAPRLLGTAIAQLVLAIYFSCIAVISGIAFQASVVSLSHFKYLAAVPLALYPVDLLVFVLKNISFGLIIGATACYHALRVERSATEVPQEVQRAIVNGLTMIFIFDGLLAVAIA